MLMGHRVHAPTACMDHTPARLRGGGEAGLTRGCLYTPLIMHIFLSRFPQLRAPLPSGGLQDDAARRLGGARQRGARRARGPAPNGPAATAPGAATPPAAAPRPGARRAPAAGASHAAAAGVLGTKPSRRATCWRATS